jgi:hypothetical protein
VRPNLCAWECKVTPAGCACQEGNTIGCIPSNDGLDAAFGTVFPHWEGYGSSKFRSALTLGSAATAQTAPIAEIFAERESVFHEDCVSVLPLARFAPV